MAVPLVLASLLSAGCNDAGCGGGTGDVKEFTIHIGWNSDLQSQYMRPGEITVQKCDRVRFVVINDDDKNKDYNGRGSGLDNFHDVALDYPGACKKNPIEHEAFPDGEPAVTRCGGKDYFVAKTKGTFRIICEVRTMPSHDELGMHADFTVE
jgi:uncharacterized cupredoxin-like copper-binding protein